MRVCSTQKGGGLYKYWAHIVWGILGSPAEYEPGLRQISNPMDGRGGDMMVTATDGDGLDGMLTTDGTDGWTGGSGGTQLIYFIFSRN